LFYVKIEANKQGKEIHMKNIISNRRSIRKYTEDHVSFEAAKEIIEIASKAPSWKNQQCWHFVLVDNPQIREQLADAVPPGNPGRNGLLQAPYVIVVLAEPESSGELEGKPYYLVDGGIVFSTLMLAAAERGLGTCFIGWREESVQRSSELQGNRFDASGCTPVFA
jgi:nitroreductase